MDAVEPGALVRAVLARFPNLSTAPFHVVAAGKAASPMFGAAAEFIRVRKGVIAAQDAGMSPGPADVERFRAGHPAPNGASVAAAERTLQLAGDSATAGGLLVLLSGGASAMLAAPADGVALADKVSTSRLLMGAGAPIDQLNCVRKHLSRIKGGRLAALAGRTVTFALSDVHAPVADDPSVIASGPTVPDETTFGDALDIVRSRGVVAPPSVMLHLERGVRGEVEETIKPGDARVREAIYTIVGNRHTAMAGARREAEACGYRVIAIAAATHGEAREAGPAFVKEAMRLARDANQPVCVIASGETTVTVCGDGMGGRNQEFVLAAAAEVVASGDAVVLASAGTDGIDGPTDAAGAMVDVATLRRAAKVGVDAGQALARNDAYRFFEPLGDLIRWGPTGTNVGDLQVILFG